MVAIPAIVQRSIDQLQFQVRRLSDSLQRDNWFRRRRIDNIVVSATPTSVRHALGYEPEGFVVIRKNANVTVYNGTIDASQIVLTASGSATISIVVW